MLNKKRKVRFLNLSLKKNLHKLSLIKSITNVLDHGIMVMGPEIDKFEKKLLNIV